MDHKNMRLPIIVWNNQIFHHSWDTAITFNKTCRSCLHALFATDLYMLSKFSASVQAVEPAAGNLREGIGCHFFICRISCYTSTRLTMSSPSSPTKSIQWLRAWRIYYVTLWPVCPPAIAHVTHCYHEYNQQPRKHDRQTHTHTLPTTLSTLTTAVTPITSGNNSPHTQMFNVRSQHSTLLERVRKNDSYKL